MVLFFWERGICTGETGEGIDVMGFVGDATDGKGGFRLGRGSRRPSGVVIYLICSIGC